MLRKISRRLVVSGLIGALGACGARSSQAQGRPQFPTNFADLQTMARAYVQALREGHAAWGLGREEHWSVDLDRREIEWSLPDNVVAHAEAQLIGTWAGDLGTFRWGWDHPSATPGSAVAAQKVKDFAVAHGIAELKAVEVPATEAQAFDLASIAVLLGDLQGVYPGQASQTAVAYIGFGTVSLNRRQ